MKNLLLLFLFCFLWVLLLPLYPTVEKDREISLPDREYVIGAMLGMSADLPDEEALKAIAVTVRTYLAYNGAVLPTTELSDLAKATTPQRAQEIYTAVKNAVTETEGEYMEHSGRIINACFHLCSFDTTADGDAPYLKSVSTPDKEGFSHFTNETRLTFSYLKDIGLGAVVSVSYGPDGRCSAVRFDSDELTAEEFIRLFSLDSTDISIVTEADGYAVLTEGIGNGAGLSLCGARILAKKGYDYRQILNSYFTDISITRLL